METSFTDQFVVFYPTSDGDTILIEKVRTLLLCNSIYIIYVDDHPLLKEPESNLKQLFHRFQVPVTEQIKEKSSMTSSSAGKDTCD
ncbi:MAG: hypothetical protein GY861_27325 [bacterium]|nr:hypothetical protein [bacterium]